jgi:hypothetical protein
MQQCARNCSLRLGPFRARADSVAPSKVASHASYQEHWPSIPSHNRSTQQRSESSEGDFSEAFRESFSTSDGGSEPTNVVRTPPHRSTNEQVASQPAAISGATPEKVQTATAQPALTHAETAKTLTLPKIPAEVKTPSQVKVSTGKNGSSTETKQTRNVPSRNETESGDPQSHAADVAVSTQQIAAVLPERDYADPRTNDERPAAGEIQKSNNLDGMDARGSICPATGDLAIAMRISSANSTSTQTQQEGGSVQETAGQSVADLHNQGQTTATLQSQERHEPDAPQASGAITAAPAGASSQTEKIVLAEEGKPAHGSDFQAEFNRFRNEPVRGAHVQIAGAENQRVDIRLQERGGALSVTVRSNDSTLATTLQDHAPELRARLSAEHFGTELWTPNSSKSPQEHAGNGNGGRNQEYSSAGERQQGQKRRQNQEPEWIREFEKHPAAFQKRIDYSWHQ